MAGPVANIDDVELVEQRHGEQYSVRMGALARVLGMQRLGCRVCEVPPGKAAWPFHNHHANEELFVILEGHGSYRYGEETHPVRVGDVLAAPPGGVETAHQIVNTSSGLLRYLAISTMEQPEVAEYPDSGKVGVIAGSPPGGASRERAPAVLVLSRAGRCRRLLGRRVARCRCEPSVHPRESIAAARNCSPCSCSSPVHRASRRMSRRWSSRGWWPAIPTIHRPSRRGSILDGDDPVREHRAPRPLERCAGSISFTGRVQAVRPLSARLFGEGLAAARRPALPAHLARPEEASCASRRQPRRGRRVHLHRRGLGPRRVTETAW